METTHFLLRDWSWNFKRFQEFWPAVHNNWPSVRRVDSLDLLEEFQHSDGWERHPEIWPAGEVELGDQAGGSGTIAALLWSRDLESLPVRGHFWGQKHQRKGVIWPDLLLASESNLERLSVGFLLYLINGLSGGRGLILLELRRLCAQRGECKISVQRLSTAVVLRVYRPVSAFSCRRNKVTVAKRGRWNSRLKKSKDGWKDEHICTVFHAC